MRPKIEKGIKVPKRRYAASIYGIEILKKGESILICKYTRNKYQAIASSISHYKSKNPGKEFTLRKTHDNKIRAWRIK